MKRALILAFVLIAVGACQGRDIRTQAPTQSVLQQPPPGRSGASGIQVEMTDEELRVRRPPFSRETSSHVRSYFSRTILISRKDGSGTRGLPQLSALVRRTSSGRFA